MVLVCYSGGFILLLKDECILILIVVCVDWVLFGCFDDVDFIYFGCVLLVNVLNCIDDLFKVFELVKEEVC